MRSARIRPEQQPSRHGNRAARDIPVTVSRPVLRPEWDVSGDPDAQSSLSLPKMSSACWLPAEGVLVVSPSPEKSREHLPFLWPSRSPPRPAETSPGAAGTLDRGGSFLQYLGTSSILFGTVIDIG